MYVVVHKISIVHSIAIECNMYRALFTFTFLSRYNLTSGLNEKGECGLFFFFLPSSECYPAWKCFKLYPCVVYLKIFF